MTKKPESVNIRTNTSTGKPLSKAGPKKKITIPVWALVLIMIAVFVVSPWSIQAFQLWFQSIHAVPVLWLWLWSIHAMAGTILAPWWKAGTSILATNWHKSCSFKIQFDFAQLSIRVTIRTAIPANIRTAIRTAIHAVAYAIACVGSQHPAVVTRAVIKGNIVWCFHNNRCSF